MGLGPSPEVDVEDNGDRCHDMPESVSSKGDLVTLTALGIGSSPTSDTTVVFMHLDILLDDCQSGPLAGMGT